MGVNDVPIVGEPIAYAIGLASLLLVLLTGSWAGSFVTVVHEGGHMTMAVLTLRGHSGFRLHDDGGGGTSGIPPHWGVGWILTVFAGYATPPVVALGGAALVASGNPWAVLWSAVILLIPAFILSRNTLASLVTAILLAGALWAALAGSVTTQAAVAVGLVWWLLFGAVRSAWILSRGPDSDPDRLFRSTLVPRIVWHAVWVVIALACVLAGGRMLLTPVA